MIFRPWIRALIISGVAMAPMAYAAIPAGNELIGHEALRGRDLLHSGSELEIDFAKAKLGTVVLFLSARCPCSASHEERLKGLFEKYSKQGFQFVAVHSNQDESDLETLPHFKKAELPFAVLNDPGAEIANALGALKTPHSYVISPRGEILYQGGVDDSHDAHTAKKYYLETALNQVIAGEKPSPSEVRVLGCVIKR